MRNKSLIPWYKVLTDIFSTLSVIMPKNFVRITAGCRCGLKGIEEISEMGLNNEDIE
ncbi:MAG: hypothetical protein ACTSQI_02415 [Candidatus Helarchaeota archaeon]